MRPSVQVLSTRYNNRNIFSSDLLLIIITRFENDRTISFIPPDGEFELMSYRLNTHVSFVVSILLLIGSFSCDVVIIIDVQQVKPLIWIESVIERHAHSRVEYMIKARSQFKRRSTANHVEVVVPVPADADSPKFKTSVGSVRYVPEQNVLIWSIKSFPVSPVSVSIAPFLVHFPVSQIFLHARTEEVEKKGGEGFVWLFFFTWIEWLLV